MPLSKSADSGHPICISMGEPAGIGPEIAVKAFAVLGGKYHRYPLRLMGDPDVFRDAARMLGIDNAVLDDALVDTGRAAHVRQGVPDAKNVPSILNAVSQSVKQIRDGKAAALVTAPVHKAVLIEGGFPHPGHTEYLAELTGVPRAVMMLASNEVVPPLRVVPLTIHQPLREALNAITAVSLCDTARIVLRALYADFGLQAPRLAVAGLNPHAGERGTMGREDEEILAPAVTALCAEGLDVIGPLSADTLFHKNAREGYDAALCMYHDQALIPIKTIAFWSGVNITLGLPIVRTSPDHGTALGIAGRGMANEASMIAAIKTAAEIAQQRGI